MHCEKCNSQFEPFGHITGIQMKDIYANKNPWAFGTTNVEVVCPKCKKKQRTDVSWLDVLQRINDLIGWKEAEQSKGKL